MEVARTLLFPATMPEARARARYAVWLAEGRRSKKAPAAAQAEGAHHPTGALIYCPSADTALKLLEETERAVRALCALVGTDGDSVELNELGD